LASSTVSVAVSSETELDKVTVPYLILTGVLIVLAILIMLSKGLPEVSEEQEGILRRKVKKQVFGLSRIWF
jgi:fucose permease